MLGLGGEEVELGGLFLPCSAPTALPCPISPSPAVIRESLGDLRVPGPISFPSATLSSSGPSLLLYARLLSRRVCQAF